MDEVEGKRAITQSRVDSSKSKLERNKLGQFATPRKLADSLLDYATTLIDKKDVYFFDPAFGTGSFYTAYLKAFGEDAQGLGFEIDKAYYEGAKNVWKDFPSLQIENTDFTKESPQNYNPVNLLVCNPPYSRHHHISSDTKLRIQELIMKELGFRVSGLAGLHFYFMLLAHKWLAKDGVGIWLVPSEIVEVNYGKYMRKYLLENVDLLRIHFFEHSEVQFDDALVSSCVIVFKNRASSSSKVEVTVGDFDQPTSSIEVDKDGLPIDKKWSKHLLTHPHDGKDALGASSGAKLGDIFQIKRGIATGNNSFFVLDKEKALSLEIPRQYLQNIVPPSRHLKGNSIELDDDGFLKTDKKLVLLNVDLPMEEIEKKHPKLYDYLQEGIANGVDKTYLASKRKLWYLQENRTPPKYFVRYMSREKKGGDSAPVFIKNDSDAIATNAYLLLYEKPKELFSHDYDDGKVWDFLVKGLDSSLNRFGRTYGGGLVKFEPSELRELPIAL